MKSVTKSSRTLVRRGDAKIVTATPAARAAAPRRDGVKLTGAAPVVHPLRLAGIAEASADADHTSHKLLDAAERIFADKGYTAANIREITAAAGANIAAVNYHFGSKQSLYEAAFGRILDHLREQRITAIAQVADHAAAKHDLELLLRAFGSAFLAPLMDPSRGRRMMQLFMREMTSPHLPPRLVIEQLVEPIQAAMAVAMMRTCPGLSRRDAEFCLHSIVGQLIHVLQVWRTQEAAEESFDSERLIREALAHIVEFSTAGVKAKAVDRGQGPRG